MALTVAQREARKQVAEQEKIEAAGLRSAFKISRNIMAEAGRLWLDGIDPSARVGQLAQAYNEPVLDAMVTAHLNARFDALVRAARSGAVPKALRAIPSDLRGAAAMFVEDRAVLTDAEVLAINSQYGAEAATLTGSLSTDLESRVATAVRESTVQGLTPNAGAKLIGQAFADAGVVPKNAYQLDTIFRTQTSTAYAAGRWQANEDPAIQEILWGYEYSTAGDDRVRLEHAALEGVQLPKDDPRWGSITPPNGFNCRCTLIEVYDTDDHEVITPPTDQLEIEGEVIVPGPTPEWQFHPLNAVGQSPNLSDTPTVGKVVPKPKPKVVPKPKAKPETKRTVTEISDSLKEETGYTMKGFKEGEEAFAETIAETIKKHHRTNGSPVRGGSTPKIIADRSSGFGQAQFFDHNGNIKIRIHKGMTPEQQKQFYKATPGWTLGESTVDQIISHEIGHSMQPINAKSHTARAWLDLKKNLKSGALKPSDFGGYVESMKGTGHEASEAWAELYAASAEGDKLPPKLKAFTRKWKNVFHAVR